ncbi:MAG: hypothetical protein ACOC6Q_01755 [Patescibacteria group bacterium]
MVEYRTIGQISQITERKQKMEMKKESSGKVKTERRIGKATETTTTENIGSENRPDGTKIIQSISTTVVENEENHRATRITEATMTIRPATGS